MPRTIAAATDQKERGHVPIRIRKGEKKPVDKAFAESSPSLESFRGLECGVALGPRSKYLIDLDLDVPEAVDAARIYALPTGTKWGRESNRCSHYLYYCKGLKKKIVCTTEDGVVLAELRAEGDQTMVPGSMHPSGELVEYETGYDKSAYTVEADAAIESLYYISAVAYLRRRWPKAGNRHHALLALAGLLARNDWNEDEIETFCGAVMERSDVKGAAASSVKRALQGLRVTSEGTLAQLVGQAVVDKVVVWLDLKVEEWEPAEPFSEGSQAPFPVSVLPPWLRSWVSDLANHYQADLGMPAGMGLAALATAASGNWRASPNASWVEPVNLYLAVIAQPGENKSQLLTAAIEPFVQREGELTAQHRVREAERAAERKSTEKALAKAVKDAAGDEGSEVGDEAAADRAARRNALAAKALELEPRPSPRLFTDDATPEALVRLMADNAGKMAVLSAEGRLFDHALGAYSGKGPANLNILLKGHAGEAVNVDRIGREPERIESAILTIGLAVQPAVICGITDRKNFSGQGFLARFLYVWPISQVGERTWAATSPQLDAAIQDRYRVNMLKILDNKGPHVVRFTAKANVEFCAYMNKVEERLKPDGDLAGMHYWPTKLRGAVLRLTGLLHVARTVDDGDADLISVATLRDAIKLGEYFVEHAKFTFGRAGLGDTGLAESLWGVICKKEAWIREGVTVRDLCQAIRGQKRFSKKDKVMPALLRLERMNYVRVIPCGAKTTRVRVNPDAVTG